MMADLAILAKFCQISQNYANCFNRCHPAVMAYLVDLAILAVFVNFLVNFRQFHQISQNYANDFRCLADLAIFDSYTLDFQMVILLFLQ